MLPQDPECSETLRLLNLVQQGNRQALNELLARHRDLLRRFVEVRLDPRLRRRIDPSDVVQEALMEVARRIADFLERQPMPFHLWIRQTTYQNLLRLRRLHVEADCRSVAHEVAIPEDSSMWLACKLLGKEPGPEQKVVERELALRLQQALGQLSDTDREVLLLRIFDGLQNHEVAQLLGLEPPAASRRFTRAVMRLRAALLGRDSEEENP